MMLALFAGGDAAAPGPLTITTAVADGGVVGERIVRIRIVDRRPDLKICEADVAAAAGIAREHGGFLHAERVDADGWTFTIDLPAL
jgi:hypothetical protein